MAPCTGESASLRELHFNQSIYLGVHRVNGSFNS